MRCWVSGIAAAVLLVASPARAQESRPFGLEVGVVQGILNVPYPTVTVVAAPWSIRVSGGRMPRLRNCYGLQVNVGRVLREVGDAKHTVGAVWADFRNACEPANASASIHYPERGGRYFGAAYDFQVNGFFIEAGPAFGVKNPYLSWLGISPLSYLYGQIGWVHRFGKKSVDDD